MDDPLKVTYKLADNDYWVRKGGWFALIQTSKSSYVNKYFQVTDNGLNNGVDKLNYLLTKVTNPNGLQTIETEIKDIDTLSFRNQKLLSIPSENNLIFKTRTAISFSDTLAEYKLIPDVSAKYNGNIIARSDYNKNIDKIMKIRVDGIAPIINKVPTQSITSSSIFYTFNTKDNESGLKPTSFILTNSNNIELKRSTQTTEKYQTIKYHFTTKGYYYLTSTDNVGNVAKQRIHVIDPDNPEPIDDNDITITLEKVYAESVVMDDPDKVTYKLADNDYWVRRNGWFALVQTSSSSYVSKYFQVTNNTLNNGLSDSSYIMTRVTNPDGLTSIVSEVKNIDTLLLGEPTILSVPNKNNVLFTTRTPMSFSDTLAEYKLIPDVSAKYNGKVIARSDYNENQDKYMKVRIDGINPTTTIISRKNNGDLTANYSFKSVDNESGLKAATLYNETTAIAKGKNGITTYTFNKSGIYSIKATDNVGNVFSTKYNVDLIRPLIYINNTNIIDNNNYTINIKNLKPVIKITDENSGIHTYKIIGIYDNGTEETIYNKTINSEKVLSDTYTLDLENIITKGIHNIKIQATDYQDNEQKGKTNTDDTTTDLIIPIDNPIIRTKYIDTHASYSNTVITTKDYKLFDLTFKILNDPNYQIGKVYQHNYSEIEKYSMQGFSENEFARKGYAPNTKFKWLNIFKNNNLKEIKPNVYEFKLYTTWDKFPKVHTKDIYFSTSEKDTITAEKILAECNATDREDTTTPVSLVYFDANQYKNINENDTTIITETVKTVDSVGNISYGQVNVYVLSAGDGTPDFNSYVRFISPKYYRNVDEYGHFTDYVTKENGGLEENSIWKTEEYKNVLDDAMRNKETNKEKDKIDNIFMKDEKEIDGTGEWDMVNSTYTFTTERIAELRKEIANNKDMFGDNEKTLEFYKDNIELNVDFTVNDSHDKQTAKVNERVKLTANANGGTGNYTYKFSVHNLKTNGWYTFNKNGTKSNTYNALISTIGEKEFMVTIIDSSGKEIKSDTVKVNCTE